MSFQEMRSLQVRGIDRGGIIESIKGFQRKGTIEAREMRLLGSLWGEGTIRQWNPRDQRVWRKSQRDEKC